MYYESHEVLGTDLPIFDTQPQELHTLEDIINERQNPNDFVRAGFVKVFKYQRTLYVPLYKEKGVR